jgi:hypothetical protein
MTGRVGKKYCAKMTSAVCRVPYCRNCERVKGTRDCRGNPVGTLELVIAQALENRSMPLLIPGEGPP